MRRDPANPQFLEGTAHLTEVALPAELFGERERRTRPHLEDAVAIGVDGAREAVATEELAEEEEVAVRVFLAPKDSAEHASGGIVERGQEDKARAAVLEPRVMTAVHLDEEAGLGHPFAAPTMAGWTAGARAPDASGAQEPLHRSPRQTQALMLDEQLGEVVIIEARVTGAGQGEDPGADGLREAPGRGPAAVPMCESGEAVLAEAGQEPAEV